MALFIPKGKVPRRTYSMVLDTGVGTIYYDPMSHVAEWSTPLGCIQKESICILEQFSVDTNGVNAVYANMFCIRLLNGAGSPDSFDSTQPTGQRAGVGGLPVLEGCRCCCRRRSFHIRSVHCCAPREERCFLWTRL